MNYSKKFNTTKKAIAEIKRLENKCARLAKMDLCEWSITLEQHIEDNNKEISRLQESIVQFRKTQDYQSGKIGELLEEVKNEVIKRRMCEVDLKNARSVNEGYKEVLEKRDKTINMLQVDMGFMSRAFMEQGVMFHTGRELTSGYDEKCDGGYKSTMTDLKAGV